MEYKREGDQVKYRGYNAQYDFEFEENSIKSVMEEETVSEHNEHLESFSVLFDV